MEITKLFKHLVLTILLCKSIYLVYKNAIVNDCIAFCYSHNLQLLIDYKIDHVLFGTGIPYCKGRLSTVDLLALASLDQLL